LRSLARREPFFRHLKQEVVTTHSAIRINSLTTLSGSPPVSLKLEDAIPASTMELEGAMREFGSLTKTGRQDGFVSQNRRFLHKAAQENQRTATSMTSHTNGGNPLTAKLRQVPATERAILPVFSALSSASKHGAQPTGISLTRCTKLHNPSPPQILISGGPLPRVKAFVSQKRSSPAQSCTRKPKDAATRYLPSPPTTGEWLRFAKIGLSGRSAQSRRPPNLHKDAQIGFVSQPLFPATRSRRSPSLRDC